MDSSWTETEMDSGISYKARCSTGTLSSALPDPDARLMVGPRL